VLHWVFLLVDLRAEDSSSQWPGYRGKGHPDDWRNFLEGFVEDPEIIARVNKNEPR
jgi:hypothetical protein